MKALVLTEATNYFIQCNTLSALTFLVYDILLMLPLEVEYVWKHRWSSGKVLYAWGRISSNRFFGLSAVVFNAIAYFDEPLKIKVDLVLSWWQGMSVIVGFLTIEFILQARIFAVYEGNKKLLFVVTGAFLVMLGATLTLFVMVMHMYSAESYVTKWYPYVWIPSVIFDTFLCLLMVFKATTLYRRRLRNPLVVVIFRDSILYLMITLTTMLVNCIGSSLRPSARDFGLSWAYAVPCALGSRLLLNMRREYFDGRECFNDLSVGPALGGRHTTPMWSGVLSSVILSTSR